MAISRAQLAKELEPGLNALFVMEYDRYDTEHKEIYDKASTASYELLKINQKGEEADERRKTILAEEGKQTVSRKKDSKSTMDE